MFRFVFLCAVLLAAPQGLAQSQDYVVARDTPSWFKQSFMDFPEDVAEAAESDKRVMVYFGQNGCPYCKKLHDSNYRQAEIVEAMQTHLDSIAINMFGDVDTVWLDGNDYTEKELAEHLQILFTPTLLFLDEDGKEVLRLAGYQPPQKFKVALDYVTTRQEAMPFAEYLRKALPRQAQAARPRAAAFAAPPYGLDAVQAPTAVLVTQRECANCDEWRDFMLSDEAAPWRAARRVVEVDLYGKADTGGGVTEAQWAAQAGIGFVPAIVFLDAQGVEEFRIDGYLRPFHLHSVWDYVVSGAVHSEPEFQRYLQARADRMREEGAEVKLW